MPASPSPTLSQHHADPRVVRSPGRTLEDMLLEQERELDASLGSTRGPGRLRSVRGQLRRVEPLSEER
ncbi:MAG TPA: hypothetical protein VJR89_02720 [Polyangiales bacterium]|nr:hypothetical protein [Polyangiales bacterium]